MQYDTVASMYDAYVTTTFDIPFLIGEARKVSGHVLELMAGTGRVTIPLAEAGVRLTSVDQSPEMLAILRRKLTERQLEAVTYAMDVRHLSLPQQFDLVLIPFHSFSELVTHSDQERTLAGVYPQLADRGALICPLHNPRVRLQRVDDQFRLWGKQSTGEGDAILLWGQESYDRTTQTVSGVEFFERYGADGTMRARVMVELSYYLFDRDEFETMATSAGFQVQALYGDYSYAPFNQDTSPFMIWVLKKVATPVTR